MSETILITGGSSGVGKSLVKYLSDRFDVITIARRIDQLESEYEDYDSVYAYELDLEKIDQIEARISELNSKHGPILYLINNAAINRSAPMGSISIDDMMRSMKINTLAPLEVLQTLLPIMKDHDFGRVINVTSGAPLDIPDGGIPYSSSKAALNVATVTAAKEVSGQNIKINLMSPGPTKSEMAPKAPLSPTACHPTVDFLLSLDRDGPTGRFYWLGNEVPLFPKLGDVDWESGNKSENMERVIPDE
jgi:NAD(P)-dependent dehydrogenase (short-subunit alcohol dehydrogenase family)